MKTIKWCIISLFVFCYAKGFSQGPPITSDKPIMLGANTWIVKTLSEIRNTNQGTFSRFPLMVHYLPTANTLIGVHLPFVHYQFNNEENNQTLGDIELRAKHQFYRNDKKGKTFRLVAKTAQTLATGKEIGIEGISTNQFQSYWGMIAGYESIKYGISNELGYNISIENSQNELRYKLGFGLPLLKQSYPVNQINLHFEYQSSWFVATNEYLLLYAQGIQYAKGSFTFETAIQFPLQQTLVSERQRIVSLFLGTRYVF